MRRAHPHAVRARLVDEELRARTVDRFRGAVGLHREAGRVHLGEHDEPRAVVGRPFDHRREPREVRLGVFPHDVVLDAGDDHFAQALQTRARFVEHLGALAAREPHQRRARGDVVVEHDARHRDHPAPMRQRSAEREPVGLAERTDVDGDEVGALRPEHVEARVRRARAQSRSRLSSISLRNCGEVLVGQLQADRDRVLERSAAHVGEELLRGLDRGDELGRRADPADLPARERERLAARPDRAPCASRMPGSVAIGTCSPSYTRCSYTSSVTTSRSCSCASSAMKRRARRA